MFTLLIWPLFFFSYKKIKKKKALYCYGYIISINMYSSIYTNEKWKKITWIVHFQWTCGHCCLRFLFLPDRSAIRCGLLSPCFSSHHGCKEWVFEFEPGWPFSSHISDQKRCSCPQNIHVIDGVFFFPYYSM